MVKIQLETGYLDVKVTWAYDSVGSYFLNCELFDPSTTVGIAFGTNGSNIVILDTKNYGLGQAGLWQYQPETSQQVNNFDGWVEIRVY